MGVIWLSGPRPPSPCHDQAMLHLHTHSFRKYFTNRNSGTVRALKPSSYQAYTSTAYRFHSQSLSPVTLSSGIHHQDPFETWRRHLSFASSSSCSRRRSSCRPPRSSHQGQFSGSNGSFPQLDSAPWVIPLHFSGPTGQSRELAWKSSAPIPLDKFYHPSEPALFTGSG